MNLLLFSQDSIQNLDAFHSNANTSTYEFEVRITNARQIEHVENIHNAKIGDSIKVGLINHRMGTGIIQHQSISEIILHVQLNKEPPAPLNLQLVLGLPRPKMLKRCLQSIASLGVKKIYLINSYRVEKSFWQTPWLEEEAIHEQLILGLEQGCDTQMPEVHLIKRFKPFVEDEMRGVIGNSRALVAHPYCEQACPTQLKEAVTLAIGPEGGFIPYEIDLLQQQGFSPVHLGERIMRVETAVPYILGKLMG